LGSGLAGGATGGSGVAGGGSGISAGLRTPCAVCISTPSGANI
jgi:hypothetical protein